MEKKHARTRAVTAPAPKAPTLGSSQTRAILTSRRAFVAVVTGVVCARPLAGRAQPPALALIGFLSARAPAPNGPLASAFRQGLAEGGYVDGRTVVIEYRWADGRNDRLQALAADLVRRQVAVIAAISGTPAAMAAKAATRAIPIVFANGGDPIRSGLVTSLARPAANVTGVTFLTTALAGKRLEMIRALLPTTNVVGFLLKPNNPAGAAEIADARAAAHAIGLQLQVAEATSERAIGAAFAALVQRHAGAVLVGSDPLFGDSPSQLIELAARHAVPTMYFSRDFVDAGGLMSYGSSPTDAYRQAGVYTSRILKGAKPADLPVLQPSRFELVINLKTARALGLAIPPSLLQQADQVVE